MKNLSEDPKLKSAINAEEKRQRETIELIASENFASPAVREAAGTVLTNKYAEGLPGKRYYGGCEHVDKVERLAKERAKKLFGTTWANVQPHSGAQANAAVFLALLDPGDTFLGLDLSCGGHLTHGAPVNFSGKIYDAEHYGVRRSDGRIDLNRVEDRAKEVEPKIITIGASAYPRDFNYRGFRQIANQVGAYLWMDMAHTAGLIASGVLNDPAPYADVITTTTHKTLRGARGGMILTGHFVNEELESKIDSAVFPGTQGGPLMHVVAAKAAGFKEALQPSFKDYSRRVVQNSRMLANVLGGRGYKLVTNGTDNHLVLIDFRNSELTGKEAEERLEEVGITANKNMVPYDEESPFVTSGLRVGTPAMTTRGFERTEFQAVGNLIADVLEEKIGDEAAKEKVTELCADHPMP
jgi:glycine hydroxymethyltransferase